MCYIIHLGGFNMKSYVKAFDGFSKLLKVLLALPFFDILWVIYRICRSGESKNTLGVVLGVIMLFVGIPFLWLVDMITLATDERVIWFE